MSKREPPPEPTLGIDLKGNFNFLVNITMVFAAVIRPFLLSGQGKRAYGTESLFAFVAMPIIAVAAKSNYIVLYWEAWCLLVLFRKLFPNRKAHTDYYGESKILRFLTFGHNRFFEPILAGLVAWYLWPMPLAKLIGFGAISLAFQYRLAGMLIQRQREAIHNAPIEAGFYR